MAKKLEIKFKADDYEGFLVFAKIKLDTEYSQFSSDICIDESCEIRPPTGLGQLRSEEELCKIIVTLLSSSGAVAFFTVLKEWLSQRKTKIYVGDKKRGVEVSFEGVLNEDNQKLLEKIIIKNKDKKPVKRKERSPKKYATKQ